MNVRLLKAGEDFPMKGAYTASGLGATGLTVTVDVYRLQPGGAWAKIVDNAAASEIGGGGYWYLLDGDYVTADADFLWIMKTAGTADQKHIFGAGACDGSFGASVAAAVWNALTASYQIANSFGELMAAIFAAAATAAGKPTAADNAAAVWAAGSRTLTSAAPPTAAANAAAVWAATPRTLTSWGTMAADIAATVVAAFARKPATARSAILDSGDLELVSDDDYMADDGRALEWTFDGLPDLTGATVAALIGGRLIAGDIVDPGAAAQTVRVQPTAADTRAMTLGRSVYMVTVTRDGNRLTYIYGKCNVKAKAPQA